MNAARAASDVSVALSLSLSLSVGTKSPTLPLVGLVHRLGAQVRHVCCAGCHPWHHQARRLETTRVLPLSLRWRGRGPLARAPKHPPCKHFCAACGNTPIRSEKTQVLP